jgi:probable HAF family extracellular repeat protein
MLRTNDRALFLRHWGFKFAAVACCSVSAAGQPAEFIPLGGLTTNPALSRARGVSADGKVVVGICYPAGSLWGEGFVWTREQGMRRLGTVNPTYLQPWSEAWTVSLDGSVIGGRGGDAGAERTPNPRPIIWRDGQPRLISPLTMLGGGVNGVSADGRLAVGSTFTEAFFCFSEGWGSFGAGFDAAGVSADGTAIALNGPGGAGVLRWGQPRLVLDTRPGDVTTATAISADGGTIVGYLDGRSGTLRQAFRWTAQTGLVGLGPLGTELPNNKATGVSAGGFVVVGTSIASAASSSFIWDAAHGMRDLVTVLAQDFGLGEAMRGWSAVEVYGISPDGRTLVGEGYSPRGVEGWVVHLGYACYANCDGSIVPPVLNAADFMCFLQKFSAADPYANCDGSTNPPFLNAGDFQCFLNAFAAGCS